MTILSPRPGPAEPPPFPDPLHLMRLVDRTAGAELRVPPHRHAGLHQIFLMTAGEVVWTAEAVSVRVPIPAVVNMPSGQRHGFWFSENAQGYMLTLPVALYPELFAATAETATLVARGFSADPGAELMAAFSDLEALYLNDLAACRLTLMRAAAVRLVALAMARGQRPVAADGALPADQQRPAEQHMAALQRLAIRHLGQGWSVADYAEDLGLTPRHLSRICQAATGLSTQGYLQALALREACRLLAYTRMPVQAVGRHVGFKDASHFARVFQRQQAMSPTAYRARFDQ